MSESRFGQSDHCSRMPQFPTMSSVDNAGLEDSPPDLVLYLNGCFLTINTR